jgi:hypothetical protein
VTAIDTPGFADESTHRGDDSCSAGYGRLSHQCGGELSTVIGPPPPSAFVLLHLLLATESRLVALLRAECATPP